MTSAKTLASYLLFLFKEQMQGLQAEEFDVTPLKLQKLLYYCQGYSLALTGKTLFSEPIEAWKFGPVVESVYQEYKKYKGNSIPYEDAEVPDDIDDTTASIASMVVNEKGRLSGMALAAATHKERPWKETFSGVYNNDIIPVQLIQEFFIEENLKQEELEDNEDAFWASVGHPVSNQELEAALAKI